MPTNIDAPPAAIPAGELGLQASVSSNAPPTNLGAAIAIPKAPGDFHWWSGTWKKSVFVEKTPRVKGLLLRLGSFETFQKYKSFRKLEDIFRPLPPRENGANLVITLFAKLPTNSYEVFKIQGLPSKPSIRKASACENGSPCPWRIVVREEHHISLLDKVLCLSLLIGPFFSNFSWTFGDSQDLSICSLLQLIVGQESQRVAM